MGWVVMVCGCHSMPTGFPDISLDNPGVYPVLVFNHLELRGKNFCLNTGQGGRGLKTGRSGREIHRVLNTFSTEFVEKGRRALMRLGFFQPG
jgi:hypothetical protein